jgi:hypothetical protein
VTRKREEEEEEEKEKEEEEENMEKEGRGKEKKRKRRIYLDGKQKVSSKIHVILLFYNLVLYLPCSE